MAEVTISKAIEKLEGDTVTIRKEGLENLKFLFGSSGDDKISKLTDDILHKTFESLYRIVRADRAAYLKATKPTAKSTAAGKLTAEASAVRLAVQAGYATISSKTATSILDHIIASLVIPDSELCEPLRNDYLKCLRILLDYNPHGEHLKSKQWQAYVDFVVDAILRSNNVDDSEDEVSSSRGTPLSFRNGIRSSTRASQPGRKATPSLGDKTYLIDLTGALRSLTGFTNAPLKSRATFISDNVLNFISHSSYNDPSLGMVLEVLNNIVFVQLTEDIGQLRKDLPAIIQTLRKLWSKPLNPAVRDQILITFTSCHDIFLADTESTFSIGPELLHQLFETCLGEYRQRSMKDMLSFDDLTVVPALGQRECFDLRPFTENSAAVSNWSLLSTMACLVSSLSRQPQQRSEDEANEHPRKRRRVLPIMDALLEQAGWADGSSKLSALQILFLLFDDYERTPVEVPTAFGKLSDALALEDPRIAAWSALLFARFASSPEASQPRFEQCWQKAWDSAVKGLAIPVISRSACLLLQSMIQHSLTPVALDPSTLIDAVFAGGKSGPAAFSDAALVLFATTLESQVLDLDDDFVLVAIKTIEWLNVYWTLPNALERAHNFQIAWNGQFCTFCWLFALLKGEGFTIEFSATNASFGVLVNSEARLRKVHNFVSRLLGTKPPRAFSPNQRLTVHARHLSAETAARVEQATEQMLIGKIGDFRTAWEVFSSGRSSQISTEVYVIIATLCAVTRMFVLVQNRSRETEETMSSRRATELWQLILESLTGRHPDRASKLISLTTRLLQVRDMNEEQTISHALLPMFKMLLAPLKQCLNTQDEDEEAFESDWTDSHVTRNSQGTQSITLDRNLRNARHGSSDSGFGHDNLANCLLAATVQMQRGNQHLSGSTHNIVQAILDLDVMNLLNARQTVLLFLANEPSLSRQDAALILQQLAKACLQDDALERNEVALSYCSEALTTQVSAWTSDVEDDLAEIGFDIYSWFVKVAAGKAAVSPETLLLVGRLFRSVMETSPTYGSEDLPSARTSLLKIIQQAPNIVKHVVSDALPRLFENYVLSEHEHIFDDIISNLPFDLADMGGIAVRLCIIADLGSKWHTVLRQATYKLFETMIHVPSLSALGLSCVQHMCSTLNLDSPQALFRSFSSQILYTWLASGTLDQIPYHIFGYKDLTDLIHDNLSEIVAQVALRGSEEHAETVSRYLSMPWPQILEERFAQAEAYCLASQVSLPEQEQLCPNSEKLLRQTLGQENYLQSLQNNLPIIIGHLFLSLQDTEGSMRALEKANLKKAAGRLKSMFDLSSSNITLPSGSQPHFRSKFIIQEIEWLCTRLSLPFDEIWSPALLSHLYQVLLRTATPSLGSLHACSMLRKIRVVISLGEANALQGFPLEILLSKLRPYLTIFECSQDAIGIYWYLLSNGRNHLQSRPSLLVGLAVSISNALALFTASPQDSTTQESLYVSTLSKATDFRTWFNNYLQQLQLQFDNVRYPFLQDILLRAKGLNGTGSSSSSTDEGQLLLLLLQDQSSNDPVLSTSHFDLAMNSMCKQFSIAPHLDDDILSRPEICARHADTLRGIAARLDLSQEFKIWTARVLGRGFWMNGLALPDVPASNLDLDQSSMTAADSYQSIILTLSDQVWQEDSTASTTAQTCLQAIATNLRRLGSTSLLASTSTNEMLSDLSFDGLVYNDISDFSTGKGKLPISIEMLVNDHGDDWGAHLLQYLCQKAGDDPVLQPLLFFSTKLPRMSHAFLPFVAHLALTVGRVSKRDAGTDISRCLTAVLQMSPEGQNQAVEICLNVILYLRRCQVEAELTAAQRDLWLDIDFSVAATAAFQLGLWHTALLFSELKQSHSDLHVTRSSRRSTQVENVVPTSLINEIYEKVDDPDYFYAGHDEQDLASIVQKLDHESDGYKAVSFHSAMLDATMRSHTASTEGVAATFAAAKALQAANLHSISEAVNSVARNRPDSNSTAQKSSTSPKLLNWSHAQRQNASIDQISNFKALNLLAGASDKRIVQTTIDTDLIHLYDRLLVTKRGVDPQHHDLIYLATLSELRDLLQTGGADEVAEFFPTSRLTIPWAQQADFQQVSQLLRGREEIVHSIQQNAPLRQAIGLTEPQAVLLEAKLLRNSLRVAQDHENKQFSLSRATYLINLSDIATKTGVDISAAAQYDLAKTLWAHEEISGSVKILRRLRGQANLSKQDIPISAAEVLANLAQKVADARLEPAGDIIEKYLQPAYKALSGSDMGTDAGRVFHTFAAFCDAQLQDPDGMEEYDRIMQSRNKRWQEMTALERIYQERKSAKRDYDHSVVWYKLEDDEWKRIQANRQTLIHNCLENYLLSLKACDDFPSDTLRVLSIWLDQAEVEKVNEVVHKHLSGVPTSKFAGLINQLTSRMLDSKDGFQQILRELMFRICQDHPYHSLYQVFATSKSKGSKNDSIAASRHKAATSLADLIRTEGGPSSNDWIAIHNLSIVLVRLAQEKLADEKVKSGSKVALRRLTEGEKLVAAIEGSHRKLPPPTMSLPIKRDKDYSMVPRMARIDPYVSIAGGVSAPKIATIKASDGTTHKMLIKGGNDDLRQDSIMEQVFQQVSDLLQSHRQTRRRNLGIRTYKVVPLYPNAGIIEFVQHTQPLHDYLLPAHQRYFPKDFSPKKCRNEIAGVQGKSQSERIRVYRTIMANFHPVMRFFFLENFLDPNEWFYKRLNYSRSSAAISMLGHVLGLGDRHGHNILLDTNTGEVVHIDLGVAFEAGRVLPVPELVPFRLTRDLVDGFGICGVEGVFRRCCNFTLEALRQEQSAIMTILDVLRYDPLYSWSISPLRLQRMQEDADAAAAAAAEQSTAVTSTTTNGGMAAAPDHAAGLLGAKASSMTESNDADRALSVVSKKLGKSLSVEATVNELIRQATDEKNLALLYCGWAAYA